MRRGAIVVLVVLVSIPILSARQGGPGLFAAATPPVGANLTRQFTARSRWVTIDTAGLEPFRATGAVRADAPQLQLNLFPDQQFAVAIERVESSLSGRVLRGRVSNDDNSSVALAIVDGVIAGKVAVAGDIYTITHVANGVHVIQQIDQSRLPPEAPPVEALPGRAEPRNPIAVTDDGSTIDLLVAYTPAARTAQGGTASMEALIDLGVSETNQAYANSGATQRLRLMQRVEIAYTETADVFTDLARLSAPSDGHMDAIHGMRNSYGADLVHLIENVSGFCGVAHVMTSVSAAFESSGFGITDYNCVSPNYSFAHELGHNMGLQHDVYVTPADGAYPYSHGYVNQAAFAGGAAANKRWRDIMSYANQCDAVSFYCPRLLYFSNPLNTYTGDPMGNAASADAVRTLNQTALTVANFRQSVNRTLSINDVSVSEGHSGTKTATFTVAQSSTAGLPTTVNYTTEDVTAWSAMGSNTQAINIPDNIATASPYPSTVTLPPGIGTVTKVTVVLKNFTHYYFSDVHALLVGPEGQAAVLMSAVGSYFYAGNITLTFDADAGATLPTDSMLVSGTYRPQATHSASFPAPAPSIPTPNTTPLTIFNGTNPSGTWRLYVYDSFPSAANGSIAGGWQLNVATTSAADYVPTSGVATIAAGATSQTVAITINGDANIESSETFKVNLSNAIGATIADGIGIGTIQNDDYPPFTDSTLSAGMTIKLVHLTELRTRINMARSNRGLAAFTWTDPSPTTATTIQAAHILEMRTALSQAYVAAGLVAPGFTDASLSNVYVKAAHIAELRAALAGVE